MNAELHEEACVGCDPTTRQPQLLRGGSNPRMMPVGVNVAMNMTGGFQLAGYHSR